MTRKLLIIVSLIIALTPFLGISYSAQVVITTALALFSAITLFFSRKPRMRSSPQVQEMPTPYMPQAGAVQAGDVSTEVAVRHDSQASESRVSFDHASSHTFAPPSLRTALRAETSVQVGAVDLPTHPIAPRPRRHKTAETHAETLPSTSSEVVARIESASMGPLTSPVMAIQRPRRTSRAKSMLAEEEPIRPADAVIPAAQLAREHSTSYGADAHSSGDHDANYYATGQVVPHN